MTAQAGDRLVCFADTGICDGRYEHDVRLWTDGIVAYASSLGAINAAEGTVSRDLTTVTVACHAMTGEARNGDPITCTGHAVFDLTDECWTADAAALHMLNTYAEVIER